MPNIKIILNTRFTFYIRKALKITLKTESTLNGKIKYEFSEKPWQHSPPESWYFVSLPKEMSKEIRSMLKSEEEGWGRLKAVSKIGNSEWKTAIWFDSPLPRESFRVALHIFSLK